MMVRDDGISAALRAGHTMGSLRNMGWDEFIEVTGLEPRTIKVTQNGRNYACLDVAYWDPERKQSTHRRKTIGYYGENGDVIITGSERDTRAHTKPKAEVYAHVKEVGTHILLDGVAENIGLKRIVYDVFEEDAKAIMTCVEYMASHSDALCHCEQWSAGSLTPFEDKLSDQRISELLPRIDENRRAIFFREWVKSLGDDDNYALDITSISSYIKGITQIRAGYNRDKESLEQINLAVLIGSRSNIPAYYSILPGNITDKVTLKRFVRTLKAHGFSKFSIVTDKGFCTAENMNELYRSHQRFLLGMENRMKVASDAIDRVRDDIKQFDNYYELGSSIVYCTTETQTWTTDGKNHRLYVHVYFDSRKKNDDELHFAEKLNRIRNGIMEGDEAYASSPMAKRYLKVTRYKDKITITANQDSIEEYNRNAGFLVIVSNHVKDSHEALRVYREKETAESGFDDIKNEMDLKRLRIHSESSMEGKTFLVFLSLILRLQMSKVMLNDSILRSISRREVFEEMGILRMTTIDGKNILYTERTKLQKLVFKAFGIRTPFKDIVVDPPADSVPQGSDSEPS